MRFKVSSSFVRSGEPLSYVGFGSLRASGNRNGTVAFVRIWQLSNAHLDVLIRGRFLVCESRTRDRMFDILREGSGVGRGASR